MSKALKDLVIPFALDPIWEYAKGIEEDDIYFDTIFQAWWDYLKQKPTYLVIQVCKELGNDLNNKLDELLEKADVDIKKDSWGNTFQRLCRYKDFDSSNYWYHWLSPYAANSFKYDKDKLGETVCRKFLNVYEYTNI